MNSTLSAQEVLKKARVQVIVANNMSSQTPAWSTLFHAAKYLELGPSGLSFFRRMHNSRPSFVLQFPKLRDNYKGGRNVQAVNK